MVHVVRVLQVHSINLGNFCLTTKLNISRAFKANTSNRSIRIFSGSNKCFVTLIIFNVISYTQVSIICLSLLDVTMVLRVFCTCSLIVIFTQWAQKIISLVGALFLFLARTKKNLTSFSKR